MPCNEIIDVAIVPVGSAPVADVVVCPVDPIIVGPPPEAEGVLAGDNAEDSARLIVIL